MANSCILDVDVYFANEIYRKEETSIPEVRYSLIRASPNPTAAIYITNHCDHFERIISMLGSATPTQGVYQAWVKYAQYTLANPNSSVPMIERIVRISEFVPISEITLIQCGINIDHHLNAKFVLSTKFPAI